MPIQVTIVKIYCLETLREAALCTEWILHLQQMLQKYKEIKLKMYFVCTEIWLEKFLFSDL